MVVCKSHIQAENGMLIIGLNSEFLLLKKNCIEWVLKCQFQVIEERSTNVNKNTKIHPGNQIIFLRRLKYFKSIEVY